MKSVLMVIICATFMTVGATRFDDGGEVASPIENDAACSLAPVAFLVGTWQGTMGHDDFVEEIWSEPRGGHMMGMFRWVSGEGQPRMYEILTLSRVEDDILLRLRHFSPDMIAWEERDAPVVLRMRDAVEGRAVFANVNTEDRMERIVFHRDGERGLKIDVEFREGAGQPPLHFTFRRQHERNTGDSLK